MALSLRGTGTSSLVASMLYYIGRAAVRFFLFVFTRFEVKGAENVPRRGGILVSANHLSYMDAPVVGVVLGRSPVFMAKEELFRSRFFGGFISMLGAFPVHRGRVDREAMRRAERIDPAQRRGVA